MNRSGKQNQKAGDNSTNVQIINQGISYSEAKTIAIDVFKSNFINLSKQASVTATARSEELVDDFINTLKERSPESINNIENPGLQYALFNAQKEYVRTGDKELSDVLVDILVDRAKEKERNLVQIVLDESISVVPKLTIQQMDILSLVFLLKYSLNKGIKDDDTFKSYIKTFINPFTPNLSSETSLFQHLEFTGCANISISSNKLEDIFKMTYKILFLKGFTRDEFEAEFDDYHKYEALLIPCLNDNKRLQIGAKNDEQLTELYEKRNITDLGKINQLKNLFGRNQMNNNEILKKINSCGTEMENLTNIWNESSMKNMTLTSVGIAVAHANIRRKTGIALNLGVWIK